MAVHRLRKIGEAASFSVSTVTDVTVMFSAYKPRRKTGPHSLPGSEALKSNNNVIHEDRQFSRE